MRHQLRRLARTVAGTGVWCGLLVAMTNAQVAYPDGRNRLLSHREQATLVRTWIEKRFDTLLPRLMTRAGIDMWVVVSREYHEDPVFRTLAPLTAYASRRRTILVFVNPGAGRPLERYSVGRFDYEGLYTVWPTTNDEQWAGLRALVDQKAPRVIGINESEAWNHADGLAATDKRLLLSALGARHGRRVRSAQALVVAWLEHKLPEELEGYRHAMTVAHHVIEQALSNDVIRPGVTTADDVAWWMSQRVAEMGLSLWFHPTVTVWRQGGPASDIVLRPGDMIHTDFGIHYLGFATDTQHLGYVLKPGETAAPEGLRAGLRAAHRMQDLVLAHARLGGTGNDALRAATRQARAEGLRPTVYGHPVGYHGHGAGPPIGMADYQDGVPVRGDAVFRGSTWHSIELHITHRVPEWGDRDVQFAVEEDASLSDDGQWAWIRRRQEGFHLIAPRGNPSGRSAAETSVSSSTETP